MPWNTCSNAWNTASCLSRPEQHTTPCTILLKEDTFTNTAMYSIKQLDNDQHFAVLNNLTYAPPSTEYLQGVEDYHSDDLKFFNYTDIATMADNKHINNIYCLVNSKWISSDNITEPVREFWE